jgi:ArsR family transcriptional regulator
MSGPLDPVNAELIAERFRALGDPTRLVILDHLGRQGEMAAGDLAAAVGGSQQNVSKHLAVLRLSRIVSRRKQGTSSLYRIVEPAVLTWIGAWDG